jgi:DNA-binding CsgD family transcriptional regulator
LRALFLINLGTAGLWASRFDEADRHLADGIALAHEIDRPYLEVTGLACSAQLMSWRSFLYGAPRLREPRSHAEARVLRYLPTKLSVPEIVNEMYLSVNTVKTHMRHLYDKLGAHRRHEAVEQARALGLLAPSPAAARASHPAG